MSGGGADPGGEAVDPVDSGLTGGGNLIQTMFARHTGLPQAQAPIASSPAPVNQPIAMQGGPQIGLAQLLSNFQQYKNAPQGTASQLLSQQSIPHNYGGQSSSMPPGGFGGSVASSMQGGSK